MTYFFDSSALVKWYHDEAGTRKVSQVLAETSHAVWISELAIAEVQSAFYRRSRLGEIDRDALTQALTSFKESMGRFRLEPVGTSVIDSAVSLMAKHAHVRALKTLDALHLGTFERIAEPDWTFAAADQTVLDIAQSEHYNILDTRQD
jgi:predicted nucleic acid-binding protein